MSSGGARGRSGPPPDPMSLRNGREGATDWVSLPAHGRQGDPPAWPLTRATAREFVLWTEVWRTPQAVMWESAGLAIEVALYVRSLRDAERPGAATSARTLVKQQQEALGLSLPGLARNRWRIDQAPAAPAVRAAPSADTRSRLRVVTRAG